MKCEHIREGFIEGLSSQAAEHLRSCAGCTEAWAEHQKLFALLDEWKAPEATPFFDTRLQARLREAQQERPSGAFGWLRAPVFGMPAWRPLGASALAIALAVGVGVMQRENPAAPVQTASGTAVSDLQSLDTHHEEISNLELLDDLNAADNGEQVEDEL